MSLNFSYRDAKTMLSRYRKLRESASRINYRIEQARAEVVRAANDLAQNAVVSELSARSVDDLSAKVKGIRVGALKNAGYRTVFDVYSAKKRDLLAVSGFGEKSCFLAERAASLIAQDARKAFSISLSLDRKDVLSNALVSAICRYRTFVDRGKTVEVLREEHDSEIDEALRLLSRAANPVKWFLGKSETKNRAQQACAYLADMYMGEYGCALQELSSSGGSMGVDIDSAWDDFAASPYDYTRILELLVPEYVAGNYYDGLLSRDAYRGIEGEELDFEGLNCSLRRYQIWGTKFALHQKRCILGDEMGLGKTVQAIAVMVALKNAGAECFLVICPASVLENWCREINEKSAFVAHMLYGDRILEESASWLESMGVAVTTYEALKKLNLPSDLALDLLVVDEAHYIKNKKAQRSVNTRALCLQAERVMLMTGTALENKADEMVSLIDSIRPDIALEAQEFSEKFIYSGAFRSTVAPVYLRRKRDDVLSELPDLIEQKEWCVLGSEERKVYERAVENRQFPQMRQVSWSVDDLSRSSKAARMMEIISTARQENRKVIVFSFFLSTLSKVCSLIDGPCFGPITGSVSPRDRQLIIDEFNQAPDGAVLVSQIQAGGTGLNVQSASVVIICEPQLKPSSENQAISRAYRMGQVRNVLVYRLLASDSVDEGIDAILAGKKAEFLAFADRSDSADESFELNDAGTNALIERELKRIQSARLIGGKEMAKVSLASESLDRTVSQRAREYPQPRGGFVNPKALRVSPLGQEDVALSQSENISAGLIGCAVDYLTRVVLGESAETVFAVSLLGARLVHDFDNARRLTSCVKGLDDQSIVSAIKLSGYDVCRRASPAYYRPVEDIAPDQATIGNVKAMVKRASGYLNSCGGIRESNLTFEGGYTDIITSGDGDFMTSDTLWDMKTSKKPPTKEDTLQLLIYWRLGVHSMYRKYDNVKYLGICNPRLNRAYLIALDEIPSDIVSQIDAVVIGYN